MTTRLRSLLPLLPALLLVPAARADVLSVSPSGPFFSPQAAIDAAVDGDTILVQGPATYDGFTIDAKGVSVLADGGPVDLVGPVVVRDTGAAQTVLVAGFDATGFFLGDLEDTLGLLVEFAAGPVRLVDCTFTAADNHVAFLGDVAGVHGAICALSDDVAFTRCTLRGGEGYGTIDICECIDNYEAIGGDGLLALGTHVQVADSLCVGGLGGYGDVGGGVGGAGISIGWGSLTSSGSAFVGGEGGHADAGWFGLGADGGPGLFADASSPVLLHGVTTLGGPGGWWLGAGGGSAGQGDPGPPLSVLGPLVQLPGPARRVSITTPVREGETATLQLRGAPGDLVFLAVAVGTGSLLLPHFSGALVAPPPWLVFEPVAVLPGSGLVSADLVMPPLPPGVLAADLWLQALMTPDLVQAVLSSWSPLVIVDDSL